MCKCKGVEMFGEGEDFANSFYGIYSEGYSKKACFLKDAILDTNYGAGSHNANPIANSGYTIKYMKEPFELYHTKWQNWAKGVKRQAEIAPRRSDNDKKLGWNFHYSLPESAHKDYWTNGMKNRVRVREFQEVNNDGSITINNA